MGEQLSVRAYARRRGVSHTAVQKAIKDGRLDESVSHNARGWALVDPDLADQEWDAYTDPTKQRGDAALASTPDHPDQGVLFNSPAPRQPQAGAGRPQRPRIDQKVRKQLQAVDVVKKTYAAKMEKLQFEKAAGNLLDKHQVQMARFAAARATRDALYSMIARNRDALAATSDPHAVDGILREEIDNALIHVETEHEEE